MVTELTVIDNTNQSKSVTIENSTPSSQSIIEIASFLFVCIIFWITAYYVFLKKPDNTAAILLFLCSLVFGIAISANAAGLRMIPTTSHLAVISSVIGPWLLLHFFIVLPEERAQLRHNPNPLIYLIYLPASITLILYPIVGYAEEQSEPLFRYIRLIEYGLGFLAVIGVAIFNYVSTLSPRTRQQMKILLIFCIAAISPFLLLSILPSIITGDAILPSSLSAVFISLIPIGMGYSVLTQKLLDINVFIRRGVIYGIISIIMAAILAGAISIILFYSDSVTVLQQILMALILGVLASILFGPIKKGTESLIDKLFYKDKYDYRQTIQGLSTALNSITDLSEASYLIVDTVVDKLNLEGGCLFTKTDAGTFEITAARGTFTEAEQQRRLVDLISNRNSSIEFPTRH
jgi:two-component system sensor histidine kinase ComP